MIDYVTPGQMLTELREMGYAPRRVAEITGLKEWNIYRYIRDNADMWGESYVKLYNVWFMAKQRAEIDRMTEQKTRKLKRQRRTSKKQATKGV